MSSAASVELTKGRPYYRIAVASDAGGHVHVFTSLPRKFEFPIPNAPHPQPPKTIETIGHLVVGSGERAELPSRSVDAGIASMIAKCGPDGTVNLLWGEFTDRRTLYLDTWAADRWQGVQQVSGRKDYPMVSARDAMTFFARKPGEAEVCWDDLFEEHALRAFLARGETETSKTRCARQHGGKWGPGVQIQKPGSYEASSVSAVEGSGGSMHLFWNQTYNWTSKEGYADVHHSIRAGESWSKPRRISNNRDSDGMPGTIQQVAAARGRGDSVVVAWVWTEKTRPELGGVLRTRTYRAGRWEDEIIVLSRQAGEMAWASGPGGTMGLVFQENSVETRTRNSLYFISIDSMNYGARVPIATSTVPGAFDVTVAPDGTMHLVYVDVTDERTTLKYRSAKRSAVSAISPAP